MASVQVWKSLRKLQIRVVALSAILVPAAISILKQASSSHCPWDLDRYGGSEPYVRLLEATPFGISSGNCMPAGHASSALWLISLAVFFYPQRPRAAAATAGLMLWVGFSVGWMQQLRGAHFLTHTLWSMWIACAIIFGVFTALNRRASFRRIGARENCS
jgi:membrane-associated PAP2 superfamily phosphatase